MGERTEFVKGDRAPNDGEYMEAGEKHDAIMGIEDPQTVTLKKGEKFPDTKNDDRKWIRKK